MVELTTERLRLRPWRDDDVDALTVIDGDPKVMRYIGDGSVRTRQQTEAAIERMRRGWQDNGFGIFAIETRDTATMIGWTGLAIPKFLPEVLPAVEVGWRLNRRYWGQGFATEAARRVLRFGFDDARLDRIVSICHVDNHASVKVMTKLGMRRDRVTTVPSVNVQAYVYALTRAEFAASSAPME